MPLCDPIYLVPFDFFENFRKSFRRPKTFFFGDKNIFPQLKFLCSSMTPYWLFDFGRGVNNAIRSEGVHLKISTRKRHCERVVCFSSNQAQSKTGAASRGLASSTFFARPKGLAQKVGFRPRWSTGYSTTKVRFCWSCDSTVHRGVQKTIGKKEQQNLGGRPKKKKHDVAANRDVEQAASPLRWGVEVFRSRKSVLSNSKSRLQRHTVESCGLESVRFLSLPKILFGVVPNFP